MKNKIYLCGTREFFIQTQIQTFQKKLFAHVLQKNVSKYFKVKEIISFPRQKTNLQFDYYYTNIKQSQYSNRLIQFELEK